MFCTHCGAALQPGVSVCQSCGKSVVIPGVTAGAFPPLAAIPAAVMVLPYSLSASVANEVLKMPYLLQAQFIDEYRRRSKELAIAYLFHVFLFAHYGYLGRWGLQIAFWLTAGGIMIWWLVDIFRLPGMVREYNDWIALRLLQEMSGRAVTYA